MIFDYCGIPVEVLDATQAAKISPIVDNGTYTQAALDKAAPGMMAALQQELKTCTDAACFPEKFIVAKKTVKAEVKIDRRRLKYGVNIGNR